MRLVHDKPSKGSPLADRALCISCHLEGWLYNERLQGLFGAFGRIYVVNEHQFTDAGLLHRLKREQVDTFMVGEYASHTNARSRLFRSHGLRYWHYGLGIVKHYETSRFDWGMYDDDTWLRYATGPEQMPADDATDTGEPVQNVLVIGQVPGDQALQYGARGYDAALLIRETQCYAPKAGIMYRPHPRTLERIENLDAWPDSYMQQPTDKVPVAIDPRFHCDFDNIKRRYPDVKLVEGGTLDESLEQADAAVMINSTAAYEAVQARVTAYCTGIPLFSYHDGGIALLGNIDNGKHIPSADYAHKLKEQVLKMQSTPGGVYDPYQFKEHERAMLRALSVQTEAQLGTAAA